MAFIVLRRSRNTRSYALVERYRDDGGSVRSRVLCYLGRQQDGTDTLEKALTHWQRERLRTEAALPGARGARRAVLGRRSAAIDAKLAIIAHHQRLAASVAEERRRRAAHAEEAGYWQAFQTLRRQPTVEHARLAKQAYLRLAKRCHPDHGGSHEAFIRLKDAYEKAEAAYRYAGS